MAGFQLIDDIEKEGHYLEVSRYIHLNPVRAKLIDRPENWFWGSYPGYHRAVCRLLWVTHERVLGEFGTDANKARREYCRFVAEGMNSPPPCPWKKAVQGLIVGSESFVETVRQTLKSRKKDRSMSTLEALRPRPSLQRIITVVAEHFNSDTADWASGRRDNNHSRAIAAYLARHKFGYRATQVAEALGYASHGGVVSAIHKIERVLPRLNRTIRQLEQLLLSD